MPQPYEAAGWVLNYPHVLLSTSHAFHCQTPVAEAHTALRRRTIEPDWPAGQGVETSSSSAGALHSGAQVLDTTVQGLHTGELVADKHCDTRISVIAPI